jgi:hypothetical protein
VEADLGTRPRPFAGIDTDYRKKLRVHGELLRYGTSWSSVAGQIRIADWPVSCSLADKRRRGNSAILREKTFLWLKNSSKQAKIRRFYLPIG